MPAPFLARSIWLLLPLLPPLSALFSPQVRLVARPEYRGALLQHTACRTKRRASLCGPSRTGEGPLWRRIRLRCDADAHHARQSVASRSRAYVPQGQRSVWRAMIGRCRGAQPFIAPAKDAGMPGRVEAAGTWGSTSRLRSVGAAVPPSFVLSMGDHMYPYGVECTADKEPGCRSVMPPCSFRAAPACFAPRKGWSGPCAD